MVGRGSRKALEVARRGEFCNRCCEAGPISSPSLRLLKPQLGWRIGPASHSLPRNLPPSVNVSGCSGASPYQISLNSLNSMNSSIN